MQFKKQISIFLAFFLLVSNSGMAFNVHFCEGKFAGISSAFSNEEICNEPIKTPDTCCAQKEQNHKKCCSDKELNLKDKTQKIVLKTISLDVNSVFVFEIEKTLNFTYTIANNQINNSGYYCNVNAPPFYKLYSQLIFYA